MMISSSARIHPTAIISDQTEIGDDSTVGPYTIIEGPVKIGPDCHIGPRVHMIGEIVMGKANSVGTGTVLGAPPQHTGYKGDPTKLIIGEGNTIREYVTVHGSYVAGGSTIIGNNNYLMVNCHLAHDAILGNNCILVNGALIAGHAIIYDRALISGNAAIHQFGSVGKLALLSGSATATKDVPPFSITFDRNLFGGVNIVGMRRAGYDSKSINIVRKAYQILYSKGYTIKYAMALIEQELGEHEVIQDMITFIKNSKRGIAGTAPRSTLTSNENHAA
ncbi:acyl-ACP--UDP-N-acetylglucosamine O-acyltransferase [Telmatocola sphagniphila]|uniref:Acyl-ACP--UDP-N-acetylglucosamine O-acyltransferase n=1 Tax=Telmatocola sphagniphila TaxID=1123043 RepID=A0A8E6B7I9_9BACT|nr:acyl-ACP--UDP-N-acetylglucosamine O-acyltransferase [Telmatocola sphagniphila]QVL32586.1 acyl-ACP--UDP-N-acetylglucosamine O-acyltransferase [Telmatocola sphagniphila]